MIRFIPYCLLSKSKPLLILETDLTTPKFKIPRVNKNLYGMKSFDYLASNLWNSIPDELKLCKSLNDFKTRAKIYFIEFYLIS